MALAPEWMSYTKETPSSQGSRFLGRERDRGSPKYGMQLSHNNSPYLSAPHSETYDRRVPSTPFACSLSSPHGPPQAPSSILGDPPSRVLNRSKSSPGFASPPKSGKAKKSPDRNFPSFNKPKPKPSSNLNSNSNPNPKSSFAPAYYSKSQSQPNLFNNDKTAHWHQQKLQHSTSTSSVPSVPSPLATSHTASSPLPPHPSSIASPPLPPSSPPPAVVPEIDKLKQLIPNTAMPPKSVRARGVVGPPLPLTKKPPASISSVTPSPSSSSMALQPSPSTSSVPGAPPSALAAYFRKATSEPSLMYHKVPHGASDAAQAAARRDAVSKKLRAMESEKAQIQLLKEAVAAKQPKRSNFFQHLIKKEEQGDLLFEDETPIGIDANAVATTPTEPYSPPMSPPMSPPPASPPPAGLRSPLPEDMEDEERFLREMGWVPDEEEPVAMLADEEIADVDVRVKIILSKARARDDGEPMSMDVGQTVDGSG